MRKQLFWSAMLAGAMLVGCNDKDNTTTAPPTPPKTPPMPQTDMNKAADSAKDAAKSAADAAKSSADAAKDSAAAAKDSATATPAPAMSATPATGAAAMDSTDAQSKLDKIVGYIKDKKYDMADSALKSLEANKASLPASIQSQVDNARKMLDTAKAAGGMSMPDMSK